MSEHQTLSSVFKAGYVHGCGVVASIQYRVEKYSNLQLKTDGLKKFRLFQKFGEIFEIRIFPIFISRNNRKLNSTVSVNKALTFSTISD